MALEERNGRLYYYRKERQGGSVRSVYVGAGPWAKAAAEIDERDRREARRTREKGRRERRRHAEEDRALDALAEMVEGIAAAQLVADGFHAHKRQWRLIRGGKA